MPTGAAGHKKPWLSLRMGFLVLRFSLYTSVIPVLREKVHPEKYLQIKAVGSNTSRWDLGLSRFIAVSWLMIVKHILILIILLSSAVYFL